MTKLKQPKFERETNLCSTFIGLLPDGWTAYPETAGFDILLSRNQDGFQIGIEAKLRLNADVLLQAKESASVYRTTNPGPDCRAVLIPDHATTKLAGLAEALGITVISVNHPDDKSAYHHRYSPRLPDEKYTHGNESWFERCPVKRCKLPDYVPDVVAVDKSPVALTEWKIKAIKIAITLHKRGYVTRGDFRHHGISMSRWICPYTGWLVKDGSGGWVAGENLPDFKAQHPRNYDEIEADYDKWQTPPPGRQLGLFAGKGAA